MPTVDNRLSRHDFRGAGLDFLENAHYNLAPAQLIELALQRHEGFLAANGALTVRTGQFTGRSPKDKYVVRDNVTESTVEWGAINQPISRAAFDRLHLRQLEYCQERELFVQDCYGGADPEYSLHVRVVTEKAWHALFARQLFLRPQDVHGLREQQPFLLVFTPHFKADPAIDGTNSETVIALDLSRRIILIAGTLYAGEMKKSVFTALNFLLPGEGVLPMHCSANVGNDGQTGLFFGLSGTGKTTLSADPTRQLIGDDEHGWSDQGIFNFEGGCYAKCIRLSRENEPQIWNAIRFGTVLENVALHNETRVPDYDSDEITENTRAAYPVQYIDNTLIPGVAGHPTQILFLTADAFGVLPPISRLTPEQAMYHFLSGYTAKVAGTERGMSKEPTPIFSSCFGAPFLPRSPEVYAQMLGERMRRHHVTCWLVNTGWVGGPYGVGTRMGLQYTRAMVDAAIEGKLDHVETQAHPIFHVLVPKHCPGVPDRLLDPRGQWSDGIAYDRAAADLARRFRENFTRFGSVAPEIRAAAPGLDG